MSEKLTSDDLRRVNNCEYYTRAKEILENIEVYKDVAVDEVYFIKTKDWEGKEEYVTGGWNDDPAKFMVFYKDKDGFAFVKRIISGGKLGKEVTCLNTTYNIKDYWLEADPDYVNSILLENEEGYDPLAASKKIASDKNKARRRNKKLEITFKTLKEACDYIETLKVGDVIYDTNTSYGSGLIAWEIVKMTASPTDKTPQQLWPSRASKTIYGNTYEDQLHNDNNIKKVIRVDIKIKGSIPKSRHYNVHNRTITAYDFMEDRYRKYYKNKPYTVDDV